MFFSLTCVLLFDLYDALVTPLLDASCVPPTINCFSELCAAIARTVGVSRLRVVLPLLAIIVPLVGKLRGNATLDVPCSSSISHVIIKLMFSTALRIQSCSHCFSWIPPAYSAGASDWPFTARRLVASVPSRPWPTSVPEGLRWATLAGTHCLLLCHHWLQPFPAVLLRKTLTAAKHGFPHLRNKCRGFCGTARCCLHASVRPTSASPCVVLLSIFVRARVPFPVALVPLVVLAVVSVMAFVFQSCGGVLDLDVVRRCPLPFCPWRVEALPLHSKPPSYLLANFARVALPRSNGAVLFLWCVLHFFAPCQPQLPKPAGTAVPSPATSSSTLGRPSS